MSTEYCDLCGEAKDRNQFSKFFLCPACADATENAHETITNSLAELADIRAELTAARAEIERLVTENGVMYAAILEASSLGQSASLRCKVELQRIARNGATCPPSTASIPESGPTGAERQTDSHSEQGGAGEVGK